MSDMKAVKVDATGDPETRCLDKFDQEMNSEHGQGVVGVFTLGPRGPEGRQCLALAFGRRVRARDQLACLRDLDLCIKAMIERLTQ